MCHQRVQIGSAVNVLKKACVMQRIGSQDNSAIKASSTFVLAALLFAISHLATAHADEFAEWRKNRQTRFPQFEAARPKQNAEIADIKAKTAAMIAAYVPPSGPTLDQPPVIWRSTNAPVVILDDPVAPRMVVIPAGEFTMGSLATEAGHTAREAPRHRVRIGYPLAVSMFPIIVGEYAEFVADTRHDSGGSCITLESGEFKSRKERNWRDPGFPQKMISPVTCIDFNDATTYARWLSKKTGQSYRLLSEAEYEFANRAGTTTANWWGDDSNAGCAFANGFDQDAQSSIPSSIASTCHDGHVFTAPVGSFKPNGFGLFDATGNVSSWTSDCWNETYAGAPANGSANTAGDCSMRILRGGSWASVSLRSAVRRNYPIGYVGVRHGFRVARVL